MAYLPHAPGQQQASMTTSQDEIEREQRKKAVQKFLARAEISMVTRALRARLSYASYKATHNIPHVALRDLETQSQNQSQTASFNRTIAAKRKAAGANNYYNNPTTQGSGSAVTGNHRRGGSGAMAPPMSGSSPRAYHSSIHSTPGYSSYNEVASTSRNSTAVPNLYSSILAPPPSKQARTIHNPSDPPIPAPVRPTTPKPRAPKSSSIHDNNHPQLKGRQPNKTSKAPVSPNRRKNKRASVDKGKQKQHSGDMDVDGDIDMKAAATLTSLFMHHRPSIAGSASSPRSSIDGSEVGSVYSLSHFAQSSARTMSAGNPPAPVSAASSSTTIVVDPARPQTPPSGSQVQHTTPRAAPTDTEAADLMLFLATSPSPVRPANKDTRDMAAYRALGGGSGLRSKGRVLFPSTSTSATDPPSGREDGSAATAGTSYTQPPLTRGGETSFTSSVSSIGTDLGGGTGLSDNSRGTSIAPINMSGSEPSQLLPAAPLPLPLLPSAPASPAGRGESISSPKAGLIGIACQSSNPMPLDFNFHEFINASPSPSRGPSQGYGGGTSHKSNLGLRADIGRKLFEEEQMRHAVSAPTIGGPGNRQEDYTLSAGIDLVQG
ncbi:hypothetical protein BYT27DRAFT_7210001 [Phlegmacium glaucopus]|nr:hypothetical protein BYT27DRAFT_7210001 [Phlegmacium glaucopus]